MTQENTALRGGIPAVGRQTQSEIDDERRRWKEKENRFKEEGNFTNEYIYEIERELI